MRGDDEGGGGKRQGRCPLRGGEGVDRVAVGRGVTPAVGREVAAAASPKIFYAIHGF
jgi:hypothetical protein